MSFIITPTDPLVAAVADRERELFKMLSRVCSCMILSVDEQDAGAIDLLAPSRRTKNGESGGYSPENVANAALNLICNAVRQGCETRQLAERTYDEIVGKMKGVLLEQHYDAVTGRRRSNFAWDQSVELPLVDLRDKF